MVKDKKILNDALFYLFLLLAICLVLFSQGKKIQDDEKIVGVHVKGAVMSPGYYELTSDSRVKDAIHKAGGETENADFTEINLARRLVDGEEIVVPFKIQQSKTENTKTEKALSDNIININTADINELRELEGIGESIAGDIIEYRTKYGFFKSVEELKNVKGIGNSKFDSIKNKITV